jgi:transaldolase
VEVLTASVRSLDHFLQAVKLESDIITAGHSVLSEWAECGKKEPDEHFVYDTGILRPIEYQELNLDSSWKDFDISHELTDKGIDMFAEDWNNLIL